MKAMNLVEAPVDFVLVTALEEERTALLAKLPNCQQLPPGPQDIRHYYSGRLPITAPGGGSGHYPGYFIARFDFWKKWPENGKKW